MHTYTRTPLTQFTITRNFSDTDASLLRSFHVRNLFEIPTRYMNHVCLYSFMHVYARSYVYIVYIWTDLRCSQMFRVVKFVSARAVILFYT